MRVLVHEWPSPKCDWNRGAYDILCVWAHRFCADVQWQSYQLLSKVRLTLYTSSMMRMHWTLIFEVFLGFVFSEKRNWQHLYVSRPVLRVSLDILFVVVFDKNASEYRFVHYATFEAGEKVIKMLEVVSYDEHQDKWKRRKNPTFDARMWATVLQVNNFISVCTASQLALLQPCTQRDAMDSSP